MDFAVPVNHEVKIKENEEIDEYLNLARELEKAEEHEGDNDASRIWGLVNSHSEHGKVADVLDIGGSIETINIRALLKVTRILEETLLSFRPQWKNHVRVGVKHSQWIK